MALRAGHVASLIVGGVGMIFLVVGLIFLFSDSPQQEAARVEALPVFDAASLKKATGGATVLLEGRVAVGAKPVFRDFVACRREKYAGKKGQGQRAVDQWNLIGVFAPPLRLESGEAGVELVNSDYELRGYTHDWRDEHVSADLFQSEGERAFGFRAGDPVVVEGRVVKGGLEAVVLSGGGASAYREAARGNVEAMGILGVIFTALGSLAVGVAALIGWRSRRG